MDISNILEALIEPAKKKLRSILIRIGIIIGFILLIPLEAVIFMISGKKPFRDEAPQDYKKFIDDILVLCAGITYVSFFYNFPTHHFFAGILGLWTLFSLILFFPKSMHPLARTNR